MIRTTEHHLRYDIRAEGSFIRDINRRLVRTEVTEQSPMHHDQAKTSMLSRNQESEDIDWSIALRCVCCTSTLLASEMHRASKVTMIRQS